MTYITEQLILGDHKEVEKSWDEDFDKLVIPMVESGQPSYILYRYIFIDNFSKCMSY